MIMWLCETLTLIIGLMNKVTLNTIVYPNNYIFTSQLHIAILLHCWTCVHHYIQQYNVSCNINVVFVPYIYHFTLVLSFILETSQVKRRLYSALHKASLTCVASLALKSAVTGSSLLNSSKKVLDVSAEWIMLCSAPSSSHTSYNSVQKIQILIYQWQINYIDILYLCMYRTWHLTN